MNLGVPSIKPLLDRLGVTSGARVAVLGVDDPGFMADLQERTSDVTFGSPLANSDLIFVNVDSPAELMVLVELRQWLKPDGAIWVIRRKGAARTMSDIDVIEAGKHARLVDNKIASFSETHGAMRLVIPLAQRPSRATS